MAKNVQKQKKRTGKPKSNSKKSRAGITSVDNERRRAMPKGLAYTHRKQQQASSGGKHPLTHQVCSWTDPFCPAAKNSKYPDDSGVSTIGWQARCEIDLGVSNTFSKKAHFFQPSLLTYSGNDPSVAPASGVYTGVSIGGTNLPVGFVTTNASAVRLVSYGVVLRSIVPMSACQGYLRISEANSQVAATTYTVGSTDYVKSDLVPITAGMEVSWIARPKGPAARTFIPLSTANAANADFGWNMLIVEICGQVTTAVTPITAEIYANYEFIPLSAGASANSVDKLATAPKPISPALAHAATKTQSMVSGFVDGGVSTVEKVVQSAASKALSSVESMAGDFFSMLMM